MKKVYISLIVALMAGMFSLQSVDAQSRRGGNSNGHVTSGQRPGRGGNSRPAGGTSSRPGASTSPSRPGGNNAPSRPGNSSSPVTRPGNNNNRPGNNQNRPGNGNPSFRPGNDDKGHNGNHNGNRPKPDRPRNNHGKPDYRPGNGTPPPPPPANNHRPAPSRPVVTRPGLGHRPPVMAPPTRPGRPMLPSWTRPTPPGSWRPAHRVRIVPNILGMTFGLTINSALDYLYNGGYSVDGYGNREVYLRNVSEMGYYWDDATLYFDAGGLVRSQFFDSSAGYSTNRFYNIYNSLTADYGMPVSQSNNGSTITATWFGYEGDYITLQYTLMNSSSGYRYFTILTYGD